MTVSAWPWLALIMLGAWHGLNPGMGWLFSVALGLQERSRRAVFVALLPIALGHALASARREKLELDFVEVYLPHVLLVVLLDLS
jgi:hypothetical protein